MNQLDQTIIQNAMLLYSGGQKLAASRLICDSMPRDDLVNKAGRLLGLLAEQYRLRIKEVDDIASASANKALWQNGHRLFDAARMRLLQIESNKNKMSDIEVMLKDQATTLMLSELVAQIMYNATDPDDPFDEDSHWYFPVWALELCDRYAHDSVFTSRVRTVLYE